MHGALTTHAIHLPIKWEPPPLDSLKANNDVAWKEGAIVVHDDLGFMKGLWFKKCHTKSMEEANTLATLKAC